MLLATQCPHCFTSFRVANDQLKLHAGLVRCGSCQQTFNGIEYLLAPGAKPALPPSVTPGASTLPIYEDHPKAAETSETFTPIQVAIPTFERALEPEKVTSFDSVAIANVSNYALSSAQHQSTVETSSSNSLEFDLGDDTYQPQLEGREIKSGLGTAADEKEASHDDSLSQISLINAENDDISLHVIHAEPSSTEQTQGVIDALNSEVHIDDQLLVTQVELDAQEKKWNMVVNIELLNEKETVEDGDLEKPDFVIQAEKKQRRSRVVRVSMIALSTLLFFGLLAQCTYIFHNHIVGWFPHTKPVLQEICKILHCRIELPAQIEAISIESNELLALSNDKNIFSLSIQLQNKSGILQAWPMLELVLNDVKDRPVVRRVFTPADYLANKNDLMRGLTPNSDETIKLYFELSGPKAAGYHVDVFYP